MSRLNSLREQRGRARVGSFYNSLKNAPSASAGTEDDSGVRFYSAIQNRNYPGPDIHSLCNLPVTVSNGDPVFLGPNGQLYDVHYNPCFKSPAGVGDGASSVDLSSVALEKLKRAAEEHNFDLSLISRFPEATNYESYEDFEAAVLEWRSQVKRGLSFLQLPQVLGRFYYRPRISMTTFQPDTLTARSSSSTSTMGDDHSVPPKSERVRRLSMSAKEDSPRNGSPRSSGGSPRSASSASPKRGSEGETDEDPDLFDKKWEVERDPWESFLVPKEPDPSFYQSYEEYRSAMKRWGKAVAETLQVVPPHPKQLQQIILLDTFKHKMDKKRERLDRRVAQGGRNIIENNILQNVDETYVISGVNEIKGPNYLRQSETYTPIDREGLFGFAPHSFEPLDSEDAEPIIESFKEPFIRLYQTRKAEKQICNSYLAPILPRLRMVFIEDPRFPDEANNTNNKSKISRRYLVITDKQTDEIYNAAQGSLSPREKRQKKSATKPSVSSFLPLRRGDLTRGMFDEGNESQEKYGGKTAQVIPRYDIVGLDYEKISKGSTEQVKRISKALNAAHTATKLDEIFSWYHPHLSPETLRQWEVSVTKRFDQFLYVRDFQDILSSPMMMDQWLVFLQKSRPDSSIAYHAIIQDFIMAQDELKDVLRIFDNVNNRLFHCKLAVCISHLVSDTREAGVFIKSCVEKRDVELLHYLAFSQHVLDPSGMHFVKYSPELLARCSEMIDVESFVIVEYALMDYYLMVFEDSMERNDFALVNLNIEEIRKELEIDMMAFINSNRKFFEEDWYNCISSRSVAISSLFHLITSQFLKTIPSASVNFWRCPGFYDSLRNLTRTKYSHVKFAVSQIYRLLGAGGQLQQMYSERERNPIPRDVMSLSSTENASLLSNITVEVCRDMLESYFHVRKQKSAKQITFLLQGKQNCIFHELLKETLVKTSAIGQDSVNASIVICALAQAYYKLGFVRGSEDMVKRADAKTPNDLVLCPKDLRDILQFPAEVKESSENADLIKSNFLKCLKYLCKVPLPFDAMKKDKEFYCFLFAVCKDVSCPRANVEAWNLLYVLIRYHSGVMAVMEGGAKVLSQFLDLLSPASSDLLNTNILRSLARILNIVAHEAEVIHRTKKNSRGDSDTKSYQKDVGVLTDAILKKHMFVKVHMIYKKVRSRHNEGKLFEALSQFYLALYSPGGVHGAGVNSKLMRDVLKHPEYKAGLMEIVDLAKARGGN